jgi:hypothetical protein
LPAARRAPPGQAQGRRRAPRPGRDAAVGAAGSLAGVPTIQAITEIANRIIAALPASVLTNDDDYVDSFYTIEEFKTYTGRIGAGNNATISIQPFTVVAN